MLTLTMTCQVTAEHTVTIRLPDHVAPGSHEIVVILDRATANTPPSSDPEQIRTQRLEALEKLRAQLGGALSGSEAFATAKREEIELEERKFAR